MLRRIMGPPRMKDAQAWKHGKLSNRCASPIGLYQLNLRSRTIFSRTLNLLQLDSVPQVMLSLLALRRPVPAIRRTVVLHRTISLPERHIS